MTAGGQAPAAGEGSAQVREQTTFEPGSRSSNQSPGRVRAGHDVTLYACARVCAGEGETERANEEEVPTRREPPPGKPTQDLAALGREVGDRRGHEAACARGSSVGRFKGGSRRWPTPNRTSFPDSPHATATAHVRGSVRFCPVSGPNPRRSKLSKRGRSARASRAHLHQTGSETRGRF